MNKVQAINYLRSSGFSEEQIEEIVKGILHEPKIRLSVDIEKPVLWYRESTKEWVVFTYISTPHAYKAISFPNKKRSKAIKAFYRFFTSRGILEDEMMYLFGHNMIEIEERE